MKAAYLYILACADGSYYTGSTTDLARRLREHSEGNGARYTRKRLPVELVYWEQYHSIAVAFAREKQIQGWRRAKKEALIQGNPERLPKLARNYTRYGQPIEIGYELPSAGEGGLRDGPSTSSWTEGEFVSH